MISGGLTQFVTDHVITWIFREDHVELEAFIYSYSLQIGLWGEHPVKADRRLWRTGYPDQELLPRPPSVYLSCWPAGSVPGRQASFPLGRLFWKSRVAGSWGSSKTPQGSAFHSSPPQSDPASGRVCKPSCSASIVRTGEKYAHASFVCFLLDPV